MAPRNQNRHLDSSSVAPVAVAKRAPRRKGSRHAGSSRTESKVSEEEFDLQEIEDGAETSDTSGPRNLSPELERQDTRPQQADILNVPVKSKNSLAVDLIHFFDNFKPVQGRRSSKSKEDVLPDRICKLCAYVRTFDIYSVFLRQAARSMAPISLRSPVKSPIFSTSQIPATGICEDIFEIYTLMSTMAQSKSIVGSTDYRPNLACPSIMLA